MKIAVTIKMCNFPFGKPSSVPGNSHTAHMLGGICFTALVIDCESVSLRLSVQARTIQFHFSGEEVRSNSRKWLWLFFFSCLSLNLPLVSMHPHFNSRTSKIFAEYVASSWQLLRVGKVLYFAAKNKILKVLAVSAQLQTWEIWSKIPKLWSKKSRDVTWSHLMMLYGSMAVWRATARKRMSLLLFVPFRSVVAIVVRQQQSLRTSGQIETKGLFYSWLLMLHHGPFSVFFMTSLSKGTFGKFDWTSRLWD